MTTPGEDSPNSAPQPDQRHLDDEIRASERNLADFFETASIGLHWVGPDGTILRANKAELDMLGYARDEYVGRNITEFHADAPVIENILACLTRGERLHDHPARLRCKDGSIRDVTINSSVLFDNGQFVHTRCFTQDVTDRKRTEDAVRQSEEFNRSLMEGAADCVKVLDLEGRLQMMNTPGLCTMEIDDFTPLCGKEWWALWPKESGGQIHNAVTRARAGETTSFEAFCPTAKGTPKWWEVNITPVRSSLDGPVVRLLAVSRDITAKHHADIERTALLESERSARAGVESALQLAEQASRMKDDFLATLSHEIRTPLTAIVGWSQLISDRRCTPDLLAEGLKSILRNAQAQSQLIEDILDVSRITSGKLKLNPVQLDLCDVIRAAAGTVQVGAKAKGITIEIDCHDAGTMTGDRDRLQQVFWNLFANAIKFTERGGKLSVFFRRTSSRAFVTITDTGKGMEAEFLPYVFDRFRQADMNTTRRAGGLGLGLAIVRHLVELHGGNVAAQSEGIGRGSVFTVELPIIAIHETDPQRGPGEAPGTEHARSVERLHGRRVLILDDDPDARRVIQLTLARRGAEVTVVGSVSDAIGVLTADHAFDAVLSDIGMPDEDGYSFIRRLRALERERNLPALKVAALTAYARTEDRTKALSAGFDEVMTKPVQSAVLLDTLAELMRL